MQTRRVRSAHPGAALLYAAGLVALLASWPWLDVRGRVLVAGGLGLAVAAVLVRRERRRRAVTDRLTGLANDARFRETTQRALARGSRTAVLLINLNGFRQVNETLGPETGDLVLIEAARALRSVVPPWALPARLGGDEFAVVLTEIDFPEQAYDVAGALASALAPVIVAGRLVPLAASIGIAVSGPGELTHDGIVHRAGEAMRRAKRLGPQTRWAVWQEHVERDGRAAA